MKKILFKILALFLLMPTVQLFAQQHITLNTYSGQHEIRASGSVTLTDGFFAPAGSNLRIFTGQSYQNCSVFASAPSGNQNYVSSKIFKVAGVNAGNINDQRSICAVNEIIQYSDGLGRPLQTVTVNGSLAGHDLVQPFSYDGYGREALKYQPYSVWNNNGAYRADALTGGQAGFYNAPPAGVQSTASPFSLTVFEPSPLNRATEQGAPGTAWQPVPNSNAGHTVKMQYGTNAGDVKLWTLTGNGAASSVNYPAGKLYKTTTSDENWQLTDGLMGTTDEYKDFEGRVVLKRIWENNTKSLSTYYVYDDLGNLRYVLPPAVNENGQASLNSFIETDAAFDNFIYGYHYDNRNRVIEKKIPGKGWEFNIYNVLDQVVLTQDAVQRQNHQWSFTKYDAFGRTIITGLYNDGTDRAALQAGVNAHTAKWESRSGSGDYSNNAFPQTIAYYHSISYYDDYNFPGNHFGNPTGTQVSANRVKGLLTGSKVTILGTGTMLLSVNYYDEEGRVAQTRAEHQLSGTDLVSNNYNFAGELISSNRTHVANGVSTTIANRYENDHLGRKLASFQEINGQGEVTLSHMEYNELGQLKTKKLHNDIQTSAMTYNERGWLKENISNEFSMRLNYQDGSIPQWNGNISGQLWGTAGNFPNIYSYDYDKLNRLSSAVSSGINMSEALTYDVMGNINTLNRDNSGANQYNYSGNRLSSVNGITGAYAYDANGNATTDGRNGMTLTYNYLNLPVSANKAGTAIIYAYNAVGQKLTKNYNGSLRNYINGIEYNGNVIDIIHTEEGVAQNNGGVYTYKYNLGDHLGNVRYTFDIYGGAVRRLQQDDYYAFGKRKSVSPVSTDNKYLYNGKELQDELGEQYDYGARLYDPIVGRWNVVDAKSEKYFRHSQYSYTINNPIVYIDPDGNDIIFVVRGGGGQKDRMLTYKNGNAYWTDNGKKYNWKGANNTIARVLKAYQKIEKSDDDVLKKQLHTLESSKNHHYIEESVNGKSSVQAYGIPDEKGGVGTQAEFNFSDRVKKEFEKSEGVKTSDLSIVSHEMRHQYDHDTDNMKDNRKYNSAKDPSEIRGVENENRARSIEGLERRTTYGGEKIDPRKLKNP